MWSRGFTEAIESKYPAFAQKKTFDVRVGDKMIVTSDIYPGDWEFKVVGIVDWLE